MRRTCRLVTGIIDLLLGGGGDGLGSQLVQWLALPDALRLLQTSRQLRTDQGLLDAIVRQRPIERLLLRGQLVTTTELMTKTTSHGGDLGVFTASQLAAAALVANELLPLCCRWWDGFDQRYRLEPLVLQLPRPHAPSGRTDVASTVAFDCQGPLNALCPGLGGAFLSSNDPRAVTAFGLHWENHTHNEEDGSVRCDLCTQCAIISCPKTLSSALEEESAEETEDDDDSTSDDEDNPWRLLLRPSSHLRLASQLQAMNSRLARTIAMEACSLEHIEDLCRGLFQQLRSFFRRHSLSSVRRVVPALPSRPSRTWELVTGISPRGVLVGVIVHAKEY